MKSFLLFLCLAAAEKLDRTYLPPPGSQFSGGVDGDIQTPFETPQETYSTKRPYTYKNDAPSQQDSQIEIGINRGVPQRPGSLGDVISSGGQIPSEYYQSTYNLPTTTTSYAFTTTTTHPPQEAYETTNLPINSVTGLPQTTPFQLPSTVSSFMNPENSFQEFQQGQFQSQPNRRPIYGPTHYPATSTQPTSQFIGQNQPGFAQGNNLIPTQGSAFIPGVTQGPVASEDLSRISFGQSNNYFNQNQLPQSRPGSTQRPSYPETEVSSQGSRYPVNVPGRGQENVMVPSTSAPDKFPSTIQYGGDLDQGIISNQNGTYSKDNVPSKPYDNKNISSYPSQIQNVTLNQQFLQPGPFVQPGKVQYGSNQGLSNLPQNQGAQIDNLGRPVNQSNNFYAPTTTASLNSPFPDQFYSTPGSQPSATTVYPTGSYPTTPINPILGNQGIQTGPLSRPERPQAEHDRNAVIISYENVITPEGFSYSFDTSNGIHADESGTAVDGVKAKGSYSYIGDDGKLYTVVYTADENGFQPYGDHLPTSPPIPEAIRKVIEQAKQDEKDGISDDGTYDEDKYGHMKYQGKKQQQPNRVNIDGQVPEIYNSQYTQNNRRKPNRPQKVSKIPASNPNDYSEEFGDNRTRDGKIPVNYNQRQKVTTNKTLPGKPGRLDETNYEKYYTRDEEDEARDKITSDQPTARPAGDRKQFGGKFSVQRPDKYLVKEDNSLRQEQGSVLGENYPAFIKNEPKDNIKYDNKIPTDIKFREKFVDTQVYKDDLGDYDVSSNPTDIPSNFNEKENEEYNNIRTYDKIPRRRPGQYSDARVPSSPSNSQQIYGSRIRPIVSTAKPFDQSNVYNYQGKIRLGNINENLSGNSYIDQPVTSSTTSAPTSSLYTGSPIVVMQDFTGNENVSAQNYRPSSNIGRIQGSNYEVPESNKYPGLPGLEVPVTEKTDGPSSYNRYSTIRGRPQTSTTPVPQKDYDYYGNPITRPGENKIQYINQPISGRRPVEDNRYTSVAPTKEDEGYQYLPPQRKFEIGSQYLQDYERSSTPLQNRTYYTKGEVAKPFTTPDSYHDEKDVNITEDDFDHTQDNQYKTPQPSYVRPNLRPTTTSPPTYEIYNKENGPVNYGTNEQQEPVLNQDRKYESGNDGIEKITTIGSTRRPLYQIVTRPQPGSGVSIYDTTKGIPTSTKRPQIYYDRDGNEVTFVPSSPRPSQTTQYKVTQPATLKPENQNDNKFTVNDQTPSIQGFFPTTTRPAQRPGKLNGSPTQNGYEPSQSQYQTTYKPITTVTSGVDSAETVGTRIGPNAPFIRPGYSTQVPSTTYRPAFFPSTEKQIILDNFGRPVLNAGLANQLEYSLGIPANAENYRPSDQKLQGAVKPSIDVYGRPTTEKVIGEDFSGPKQAQKFDSEHGYYYK